jgi:hypothetical protein
MACAVGNFLSCYWLLYSLKTTSLPVSEVLYNFVDPSKKTLLLVGFELELNRNIHYRSQSCTNYLLFSIVNMKSLTLISVFLTIAAAAPVAQPKGTWS